jgi:GTP pyrophosphokinase
MAMPRGATMVDFAYAIHSNVGDHTVSAKVNGEVVSLRTEVKNGNVIEIITNPDSNPHPAWLGFARTARARSKIRQHLRTMAQSDAQHLGEIMLTQALRAEGIEHLPENEGPLDATWDKLIRFSGNRSRQDLLTDIGLGKRIASIVAKRLTKLLAEQGKKPDALLLTRERFSAADTQVMASVLIDGSENTSVRFATCCRPIPGDAVVGYLGRGEGLAVHTSTCNVAKKLHFKDSERFINVEWADQPVRPFEAGIVVTVSNGKGVLARVASALASAEADITHIDMAEEAGDGAMDLRFVVSVQDTQQLDMVLRNLRRTNSVLRAERITPSSGN